MSGIEQEAVVERIVGELKLRPQVLFGMQSKDLVGPWVVMDRPLRMTWDGTILAEIFWEDDRWVPYFLGTPGADDERGGDLLTCASLEEAQAKVDECWGGQDNYFPVERVDRNDPCGRVLLALAKKPDVFYDVFRRVPLALGPWEESSDPPWGASDHPCIFGRWDGRGFVVTRVGRRKGVLEGWVAVPGKRSRRVPVPVGVDLSAWIRACDEASQDLGYLLIGDRGSRGDG